jgi:hypothetical protein
LKVKDFQFHLLYLGISVFQELKKISFLFSVIGVMFAFMYWISAEKILIALRKYNADRMRVTII